MAEAGVRLVLLAAVLRVVDEQVGVLAPARHFLERSVFVIGEHRDLVVGCKRKTRRALVDPITKRWDGMHQEMRRDSQAADLERLSRIPQIGRASCRERVERSGVSRYIVN